jgi:hypothetical protein
MQKFKCHEPELPSMTMAEIEKHEPIGYKIMMEVIRNAALGLYNASPITNSMGLEKCMESIIEMIEIGEAKLIWAEDPDGDDEEDMVYVGYFNSATGKYQVPGLENHDE